MLPRICFTIIACVLICALSSNAPKTQHGETDTCSTTDCSTTDGALLLQKHIGTHNSRRNRLENSGQEAKDDGKTPDKIDDTDSETSFIKALLHLPCKSSDCLMEASEVCGAGKLVQLGMKDFDVADVNKDDVISEDERSGAISSYPTTVISKDEFTSYFIAEALKNVPSSLQKLTAQALKDGSIHPRCKKLEEAETQDVALEEEQEEEVETEGEELLTSSLSQSKTAETEETPTEDDEAKRQQAGAQMVELESQSTLNQSSVESAIAARQSKYRRMTDDELQEAAASQAAFSGVTKAYLQLLSGDYCTKDVWVRPREDRRCNTGYYRGSGWQAGLCLPRCTGTKKHRIGEHCCAPCGVGARRRNVKGNTAALRCERWAWDGGGYDRSCSHKRSRSIADSSYTHCRSGYVAHAGRCYKTKSGYNCVGETCYRRCTEPAPDNCSGGDHGHCGADTQGCVKGGMELAMGVIDAAVSTGMLIATCGGSAAITAGKQATKSTVTRSFTRSQSLRINKQNAMKVGRKTFMNKVKDAAKWWIKDVLIENMYGKVQETVYNRIVRYGEANRDSLAEEMKKKFEARENAASIVIKEIDPIGLANAIDSSTGDNIDTERVQAGKWMDVLSVGDPTGIVGAVAGFLKNPTCEELETESRKKIKDSTPNGEMDLVIAELKSRFPYVTRRRRNGTGNGHGKR